MEDITTVASDAVDTAVDKSTMLMQAILDSGIISVVLTAIICLIGAKIALKVINGTLNKLNIERTLHSFIRQILRVLVYFVAILIVADKLGFDVTSLLAVFSVVGAAFALAAQGSLANLFGGVVLLMNRPFLVGDYVSAGGVEGTVLQIGILSTLLNTLDNKRISVPNGSISGATIINFSTEGKRRCDLTITASYDAPIELTKKALMEAVIATDHVLSEPQAPFIRVSDYGESSISYVVRVWCDNADYWSVHFDLLENIKGAFDRNNVEMTYNHLVVHMEK